MYICKNCNKQFSKKYSKLSNGEFCCKKCARSYSSKIKRVEINKKLSIINSLKTRTIYQNNPKLCPICNKIIPYEKRMRKTCSYECGKKLAVLNNSYQNCGGCRNGSGRSHHGWYKGIYCGSTYELAFVIYCIDHNIQIERCKEYFEYEYKNKLHKYYPDFIVNNEIIEIKGIKTELVNIKLKSVNKPIKIMYRSDLIYCFEYVAKTYNKIYRKGYNNFYELYDDYKPLYEYICDNCKNVFYRDKEVKTEIKFCCRKCAGKYIQSNYYDNEEKREKISKSLKRYYKIKEQNDEKTKTICDRRGKSHTV